MAAGMTTPEPRARGTIRRMRRGRFQVRVSAGKDPSTGERIVLVDSVPIEKPGNERSERAAMREAEKLRTRLLAEADSLKVARTKATLGSVFSAVPSSARASSYRPARRVAYPANPASRVAS